MLRWSQVFLTLGVWCDCSAPWFLSSRATFFRCACKGHVRHTRLYGAFSQVNESAFCDWGSGLRIVGPKP